MAINPQYKVRPAPRQLRPRAHQNSYVRRVAGYAAPKPRLVPVVTPQLVTPQLVTPPLAAPAVTTTPRTGYLELVRADLYRKTGRTGTRAFVAALASDMGFKHTFWFRTAGFVRAHAALRPTLYPVVRAIYNHYQHKHGVWIPPTTRIGPGLFLEHLGDIVVNGRAVIGKNCNLGNGVTIGQSNRGARQGVPRLGDNIFIGPGAKIIGGVTVGDHVAIGVNCVVVKDVPAEAVIASHPGQIVSYRGSSGYVNRTDY